MTAPRSRRAERIARLAAKRQLAERPMMDGFAAPTLRQIIESEALAPMRGGAADMRHDSLFGDSHKQKELFA